MKKYSRTKLAQAYVALLDTHSAKDLAQGFAPFLLKQRSGRDIAKFSEEAAFLSAKKQGIASIAVTSARTLSKKAEERISAYIRRTEQMQSVNIISYEIDPALVGGAVIQTFHHIYNFSVTGKIKSLL